MEEKMELQWDNREDTLDVYLPPTMSPDVAGDVFHFLLREAPMREWIKDRVIAITMDGSVMLSFKMADPEKATDVWKRLTKLKVRANRSDSEDITWD